jgi:hypothetical protein
MVRGKLSLLRANSLCDHAVADRKYVPADRTP